MKSYKHVVIGGGIAGVTCVETLAALSPDEEILFLTASKLIKAITNYQKVSRTLELFDVEEKSSSIVESSCPNVKVTQGFVTSLDTDKHIVTTHDGLVVQYEMLCICTGGKPKIIGAGNPFVLGIRDTESVQEFQKRLSQARRIIVIGNGGIATELVYEVEGCEVIWAIKHKSINNTFIDPGAATFFLPHLCDERTETDAPSKRLKYTEEVNTGAEAGQGASGSALGPDWATGWDMKGSHSGEGRHIHVEYRVEVSRLLTPEELAATGKAESQPPGGLDEKHTGTWPVYVELTNNVVYGCDFVVSATGVEPNTDPFSQNKFDLSDDGAFKVNDKMETSIADVFAAGDVCSASWDIAPHWLQMRLWSQARQMGCYAAKCMVAKTHTEDIHMDFCFELFAHVTNFFNYKVILLGKFNAQGLGSDHELLLRVTKGVEYIKAVIKDGQLQGAILIGETDLEETFENLILNQTDLTPFKEHLLDPNIDIEDFFD